MEKALEDYLVQAVRTGELDTVSVILSKGANPNKTVNSGKTCLGEAATTGNVEILKLLIAASKNFQFFKKPDPEGCSRTRPIKHIRRKRKNHGGQSGESSMKCKNMKDQLEYIKPDRNQGYFVFTHNEGSSSDESKFPSLKSPMSSSSLTPSPQADLEWDEDMGTVAPTTSEDETCCSMYKWYAAILEKSGAAIAAASQVTNGIDQQDAFLKTAIHYAADKGHVGAANVLIEAGCKLDTASSNGLTPLHQAVVNKHVEIARLLLAAGCEINAKTHDKMSPLHFAACRGDLEMVVLLEKKGADLEARDSSDRTALFLAASQAHAEVVKYLISCGANVNGEDIHGYSPLCEAVWDKTALVVEALLKGGARIPHSHRLLHYAIANQQVLT